MNRKNTTARIAAVLLAATTVALASAQKASAITVLWGTPQAIDGNLDIINPGNVIRAVNFASTSEPASIDVVVGQHIIPFTTAGVTGGTGFKNDTFFEDNNPGPDTVLGDTNSDFHRVLDSFRDNGTSQITFNGLTVGETYFVQVFQSDDRGQRTVNFNIDGVPISYVSNAASFFESSFVIAEVTLDAGETSFTLQRTGGAGVQINAAVLSQAPAANAIPEPASLVLLSFAAGGMMARRRRQAC